MDSGMPVEVPMVAVAAREISDGMNAVGGFYSIISAGRALEAQRL